ncbi:hypothetical protein FRB93_006307 [Tulasnella sp. JGI-2019a]|nr:hypothetical protein FRB93_006307 [Tulasnella sp. JGI-2019a]
MHLFQFTFAALFLCVVSAVNPGDPPPVPPRTVFCDIRREGPPIVAISSNSMVNGLELTDSAYQASLAVNGFNGGYGFNGGIGAFDGCHYFYLNIVPSIKSYKQLVWQFDDKVTTTWGVGTNGIINTRASKDYPASSTFLACPGGSGRWFLYLQTGTDKPLSHCYNTQLQLK